MADKKISELTALNGAATDDELAIVDTDATETKKITFNNLFAGASGAATANTSSLATIQTSYDSHSADNSIHFTSNAIWTEFTNSSGAITDNTSTLSTHTADNSIHFSSNAIWTEFSNTSGAITDNTTHSSGDGSDHADVATNTSSMSIIQTNYDAHADDSTIHFTSNAIWTEFTNSSGAIVDNTLNITGISGAVAANTTHRNDTSDPHGANTTQTGEGSFATIRITGDQSSSGTAYAPNVIFNTTSGGITASNYTIGSLLVVYE